jgi:hypothetical protein
MTSGGYDGLWYGGIEREADARLIAAAPEMADLLAKLNEDQIIGVANGAAIEALLSRIRGA